MAQELKREDLLDIANITSPRGLLKRFYSLQEERVLTYKLFEEGFTAYLNGSPNYNFPLYRQLVHEITQTFNKISIDISAIRDKLCAEHQLQTIGDLLTKIQDTEKHKLELTVKLQLTRQQIQDHPAEEELEAEKSELDDGLKKMIDKINELLEELKYEAEELYADEEVEEESNDLSVER